MQPSLSQPRPRVRRPVATLLASFRDEYRLHGYVVVVCVLAVVLAVRSLLQQGFLPAATPASTALFLLLLCWAAEHLTFQVHRGWATTAGTIPHLATAFLLPPGAAALVAILALLLYIARNPMAPHKAAFNMASLALSVGAASAVTEQLGGPSLLSVGHGPQGAVAALVATLAYYCVSAVTVAGAVSLDQRQSLLRVLRGKLRLNVLVEMVLGLVGGLLGFVLQSEPIWAIALVPPGMLVYLSKRSLDQAERRSQHMLATSAISRLVATSTDPAETLAAIVDRPIQDTLRLDGLAVLPVTRPERFAAHVRPEGDVPLECERVMADATALRTRVVVNRDAERISVAAVPFGTDEAGEPLGVLLGWRRAHASRLSPLDESELTVLETLADYASVALESARLIQEAGKAEALRELSHLKDEFLSQVSHELRSPLAIIHGYAELIVEGTRVKTPEATARVAAEIHANSSSMIQLVEDLLDMSRLQSARLRIDPQRLEPSPWLQARVTAFGDTVQTHLVAPNIPDDLPPIFVDPLRLAQVLNNLLSNAVRYSPEGSTISVSAGTVQHSDGLQVEIRVRDRGAGIAPAEQERIFEKFVRGSSAAGVSRGAGLGLAIARSLVEAQGGSIGVDSVLGQGSTFWVRLPVAEAEPAAQT